MLLNHKFYDERYLSHDNQMERDLFWDILQWHTQAICWWMALIGFGYYGQQLDLGFWLAHFMGICIAELLMLLYVFLMSTCVPNPHTGLQANATSRVVSMVLLAFLGFFVVQGLELRLFDLPIYTNLMAIEVIAESKEGMELLKTVLGLDEPTITMLLGKGVMAHTYIYLYLMGWHSLFLKIIGLSTWLFPYYIRSNPECLKVSAHEKVRAEREKEIIDIIP